MKYPPCPLSPFAAASSRISASNSGLQIRKPRHRSTIDFQPLSFHRLLSCFFRNSFVFSNFCVAPCYFKFHLSKHFRSQFIRNKAGKTWATGRALHGTVLGSRLACSRAIPGFLSAVPYGKADLQQYRMRASEGGNPNAQGEQDHHSPPLSRSVE